MRPRWSFLHSQQEQPQSGCRNHCCATGNSRFLLKPPKKPAPPPEQQNERLTPQTCCALQTPAANSPVPGAPHPSALMMLAEDTSPTGQRGVLLHLLSPSASISSISAGGLYQPHFTKRFPGALAPGGGAVMVLV